MNNIFGQESKFFKVMNTLGSIIGVSIMWLICCIPIVTIGASTIALYYTTALLKILATPSTGFLPITGFSEYLQIGAPVNPSGLSCQGMFFTSSQIIFIFYFPPLSLGVVS